MRELHQSLPGYAFTPLTPAPSLAATLGVGAVFVKDESHRLGLGAFKILGASYAIARALSARLGAPDVTYTLAELQSRLRDSAALSLTAATEGNHGRAVAHVAKLLGLAATIYVPRSISTAAKDAIVAKGATLVELDLPYDDVVRHAANGAGADVVLIQDTSWAGYEDVPHWIVDGYGTLLMEVDEQLRDAGAARLDLVVVPAGVGSFAQAVVAHYRSSSTHRPALLVVEPDTAASVTTSLRAGHRVSVDTADTVMRGLSCGTVSEIAWPVLLAGLDAAVTVADRDALDAVDALAALGIDAGPSGAATLAGAQKVLSAPSRRSVLGVTDDAVVVLLSTEGRS